MAKKFNAEKALAGIENGGDEATTKVQNAPTKVGAKKFNAEKALAGIELEAPEDKERAETMMSIGQLNNDLMGGQLQQISRNTPDFTNKWTYDYLMSDVDADDNVDAEAQMYHNPLTTEETLTPESVVVGNKPQNTLRGANLQDSIKGLYDAENEDFLGSKRATASHLVDKYGVDAEGYVTIGDQRMPRAQAEMIMQDVVEQTMHPTMLQKNKAYRDNWFIGNTGMNAEDYLRSIDANLAGLQRELNTEVGKDIDAIRSTTTALQMAENAGIDPATAQAIVTNERYGGKAIRDMREQIQSILNNDFSSGLKEGFDTLSMISAGLNDLVANVELGNVLNKVYNDKPLTEREKIAYEAHMIGEQINELEDLFGSRSWWNEVGQGVGTSAEMAVGFAAGMGAVGKLGKFANLPVRAAIKSVRRAAKSGAWDAIKMAGIRGAQLAGRSLKNVAIAEGAGLIAAPMLPSTYASLAEKRNGQYAVENGRLVFKPTAAWKDVVDTWIESGTEIGSELIGARISEVLGGSARAFGRMLSLDKLAAKAGIGKHSNILFGWQKPAAFKAFERSVGFQGAVAEPLSEIWGDAAANMLKGIITGNGEFAQFGDVDYWTKTLATCAIYGGSLQVASAPHAVARYANIASKGRERKRALSRIKVAKLHDEVSAALAIDNIDDAAKAFASINWGEYTLDQRGYAMDAIRADYAQRVAIANQIEDGRMTQFLHVADRIEDMEYLGIDGLTPKGVVKTVTDKDGVTYTAIQGGGNKPFYICLDANGNKVSIPTANVVSENNISLGNMITYQYESMYSVESEQERQRNIVDRYNDMRKGESSAESIKNIMALFGVKQYHSGDDVTLVNGETATVEEFMPETGEFIVSLHNGGMETLPFYNILSESTLTADAQKLNNASAVTANVETQLDAEERNAETANEPRATRFVEGDIVVTPTGEKARVREVNEDGTYEVDMNTEEVANPSAMVLENYAEADLRFEDEGSEEITAEEMPQEIDAPEVEQIAPEENVDATMPEAKPIPQNEDGSINYDAIDDAEQFATLYEREVGGRENAMQDVVDMRDSAQEDLLKSIEKGKKMRNANEKVANRREQQALAERVAFYNKVLDILTPAETVATTEEATPTEQTPTEAQPTAPSQAPEIDDKEVGLITNDLSAQLTEDFAASLDAVAKAFGLRVKFVHLAAEGKANAEIEGNEVRIAWKYRGKAIPFLVGHEYTHRMQDLSPEEYNTFKAAVIKYLGEEEWNARIADVKYSYDKQKISYTDALIEDEVVADFVGELIEDADSFDIFVAQNAKESWFKRFIEALKAIFSKLSKADVKAELYNDMLDKLNTMVAKATEAASKQKVVSGGNRKSVVGDNKFSLVGVHNISLDKLRKVIKMGGLACPSIAVIDVDKQTHDDYGEYSLVLPKNMVDARQGKNAGTWAGDAWTPTYPQIIKRLSNDKAASRFYKDIDALPEAMRSRIRLDFDGFMEGRNANALAYWYLFEKGDAPEMVIVPSRYSEDVTTVLSEVTKGSFSMYGLTPEERAKCLDVYIDVKFNGDREAFERDLQERIKRLTETLETKKSDRVKKWAQSNIDAIKEYGFDYDAVADFIRDVEYDVRERGTINVDATITAAQDQIKENNLDSDYDAWRSNLDERYGIKEYIFDGYTNNGDRKYLPHTVENASKWMKKQGRQGAVATFPSFGVFVATVIPRMTTLESIRKRKALLGRSKEEYDAFREKWENVYSELGKKLQPDASGFDDYGYWRLIEAVGHNNPKEFIKKEYGIELSEEDMAQLNEMLDTIRNEYPARYFETKFERPLQLSDFTAAVVPNDIPLDVESRLKDAGVEVFEYEKGDNASRAKAMQKASAMEGVRFSIIGEAGASALDMAEEATIRMDNLAIAREMEERGDSALDIRMATGWERGADDLWRYEIMDAEVNLYEGDENIIRKKIEVAEEEEKDFMYQSKADTKELRERTNTYLAEMREKYGAAEGEETDVMSEEEITNLQYLTNKEIEFEDYKERRRNELYNRRMALEAQLAYVSVKNSEAPAEIATTRLGYILQGNDAEVLFTAYPSLRDIEVQFVTDIRDGAFAAYATKGGYKRIELNAKKTPVDMLTYYLMHEVQHAIQDVEGFAGGGNLSSLQSDGEVTAKEAYDYYRKIAGEVEARNVSARLNMSAEERMNTLLSETEDVAREDQIFLRDGVEMAMAKGIKLPKEEYAKLSHTIMERQHIYGRPSFDYATTFDNFYIYDYLGDGDSIINFAMPIIGNEELIQNITTSIDNGTITDTRSLNLYAENLQGKQRANYRRFADAFKKRHGNRGYGVTFGGDSASNGGPYLENSERVGGDATTRGTSGNIDEFANQELNSRHSLISPEMDADYLSAVERGDMEKAQQMVVEAAKLAMPNTKVVDENGNPKVVYHGDRKKARYIFSTDTFFTPKEEYAKRYTNGTGEVYATFLDIKRPFDIRDKKAYDIFTEFRGGRKPVVTTTGAMDWGEYSYEDLQEYVEDVAPNEYDGFILDEGADPDGNGGVVHRGLSFVPFVPNQIKSAEAVTYDDNGNVIPLSERFNPKKEDIRYSIIGEIGAANLEEYGRYSSPMLALEIARELEADGKSALEIRVATNWERGKDGKWRYEIADGEYIHPSDDDITSKEYRLKDILNNPDLYKAYPNLADIKVKYDPNMKGYGMFKGDTIILNSNKDETDVFSTLIHEVQHAIQLKEMFAVGGNVAEQTAPFKTDITALEEETKALAQEFKRTSNIHLLRKGYLLYQGLRRAFEHQMLTDKGYESYRTLAGEVEARNAQKRHSMSEDKRLNTLLTATEDVARDSQRVIFHEANVGEISSPRLSIREVDVTEEMVRVYMKRQHQINKANIRKRYKTLRDVVKADYAEKRANRLDKIKSMLSNAGKVDYILGDIAEQTIPYVHQAFAKIARGEVRIKWDNSPDGKKRGIASELGAKKGEKRLYASVTKGATLYFDEYIHQWWEELGGYTNDIDTQELRNALIEALSEASNSNYAIAKLREIYDNDAQQRDEILDSYEQEEERELAEESVRYEQELLSFEEDKESKLAEVEASASFFNELAVVDATISEIRTRLDKIEEKTRQRVEGVKGTLREMREAVAEVKQLIKDTISSKTLASMQRNELRGMLDKLDRARSLADIQAITIEVENTLLDVQIREKRKNLDKMLQMRLPNGESVEEWVNTQVAEGRMSASDARKVLDDMWRGKNATGVRVSKWIDEGTAKVMNKLRELVQPTLKTKLIEDVDAEIRGQYIRKDEELTLSVDGAIAQNEERLAELNAKLAYQEREGEVNITRDQRFTDEDMAEYLARGIYDSYLRSVAYKQDAQLILEGIDDVRIQYYGMADKKAVRDYKIERLREELADAKRKYAQALDDLNSDVLQLMREGKDALSAFRIQQDAHKRMIVNLAHNAIRIEPRLIANPQKVGVMHRVKAVVRGTLNAPYWTFQTTLKEIDRLAPNGEGDFYNYFMNAWLESTNKMIRQHSDHCAVVAEAITNMLGIKGKVAAEVIGDAIEQTDAKILGYITYGKGVGADGSIIKEERLPLTVSNIMYIIAMWRQPMYRNSLIKHGVEEQTINSLYDMLNRENPEYITLMNWVNETLLPETRLLYDKVHKEMFGASMAEERNYFPARVVSYQENAEVGKDDTGVLPSTITGAIISRKKNALMPDISQNYFKVLMGHLQDMDRWSAYAPLIRDINTLLSNTEFKNACRQYKAGAKADGTGWGDLYDIFRNVSAIALSCYKPKSNPIDDFLLKGLKGWATSNISYRALTAIKQLASMPIFAVYALDVKMPKIFLKTSAYAFAHPKMIIEWAREMSPSFQKRWDSGFAGMDILNTKIGSENGKADLAELTKSKWYKGAKAFDDAITKFAVDWGMTPNKAVDAFAVAVGIKAIYEYELEKMTKAEGNTIPTEAQKNEAIKKAEVAFNATQQSSEGAFLSTVQANRSVLLRGQTVYMNSPFAFYRLLLTANNEYYKQMFDKEYKAANDKESLKAARRKAFTQLAQSAAGTYLFALMGQGIKELFLLCAGGEDDGEEYNTTLETLGWATATMLGGGLVGGGTVISILQGYNTSLTPAWDDLTKTAKKLWNAEWPSVEAGYEAFNIISRYHYGVDLDTFMNIAKGIDGLVEQSGNTEALMHILNAPQSQINLVAGMRREGESAMDYVTRRMRIESAFLDPEYEDMYNEKGVYVGKRELNNNPLKIRNYQAKRLLAEYNEAYKRNVVTRLGERGELAAMEGTDAEYTDKAKSLNWSAEAAPSHTQNLIRGEYRAPIDDLTIEGYSELAGLQNAISNIAKNMKGFAGSDEAYYDMAKILDNLKQKFNSKYDEFIK